MPEMPKFDEQRKQVEELKELLRQHAVDAQRPIVLPPPAPQPTQPLVPPQVLLPPPPPPSAIGASHDDAKIAKMVADRCRRRRESQPRRPSRWRCPRRTAAR